MSDLILVDTDVLVGFSRGFHQTIEFVEDYPSCLILSPVVVAELYAGVRGNTELNLLALLSRNLLFNLAAVSWTLAMVLAPKKIDPPLLVFSLLPLALFVFKIGKIFYLYHTRVGATIRQTVAAALAGLALTHTIGIAVLRGVISRSLPFIRTPKHARAQSLRGAFQSTREELLLMLALCLAAYSVATRLGTETLDLAIWMVVLLLQAIPYMASVLTAIISAFPRLPANLIGAAESMQDTSRAMWIDKHEMPAHRMGRLEKLKKDEVDEWVKAGGVAEHYKKES